MNAFPPRFDKDRPLLVTGGAGFIGANFVLDWIGGNNGTAVTLDKLTYAGNRAHLAALDGDPRHLFVQGDIGDRRLVAELLAAHRPAAIINFAAETHVDRSIRAPDNFIQTNVVGTLELLEAARGYADALPEAERRDFRLLHVSTDEVYGSLTPDGARFTETSPYRPSSPYAASKAAADHLVRAWGHTYGLPVLTTNCSNNYGPYQYPEKLIPLIIGNALAGLPLTVYGDGQHVRDWLYVGDHCAALRQVLKAGRPGETYGIGGCCEMKNIDIVHLLCDRLDELRPLPGGRSYGSLIICTADRPGHDRRYAIDGRKIRDELGWQPRTSFANGIEKTLRRYLGETEAPVRAQEPLRVSS